LLSSGDKLEPDFVACCVQVFATCPEVGLIGGWATIQGKPGRLQAPLCPAFPEQWLTNAAVLPLAVRTEALQEACGLPAGRLAPAVWELANAVLSAGWVGVTLPVVWAKRQGPGLEAAALSERARQRFATLLRLEAEALTAVAPLAGEPASLALQSGSRSWTGRIRLLRRAARDPGNLFQLFWWLTRGLARSVALAPSLWLSAASAHTNEPLHVSVGSHG
jgi:hypothetical protein